MPMIDVYATQGTFKDRKALAKDLATAVMRWEGVPPLPLFKDKSITNLLKADGRAVPGDAERRQDGIAVGIGSRHDDRRGDLGRLPDSSSETTDRRRVMLARSAGTAFVICAIALGAALIRPLTTHASGPSYFSTTKVVRSASCPYRWHITGGGVAALGHCRLRAALPLDGAAPIADPFYRGSELIELLRIRAAQLARG